MSEEENTGHGPCRSCWDARERAIAERDSAFAKVESLVARASKLEGDALMAEELLFRTTVERDGLQAENTRLRDQRDELHQEQAPLREQLARLEHMLEHERACYATSSLRVECDALKVELEKLRDELRIVRSYVRMNSPITGWDDV